jgi:hypothetical protein
MFQNFVERHLRAILLTAGFIAMLLILLHGFAADAATGAATTLAMAVAAVPGVVTTSEANENAPGLLHNDVDRKIVKLRPMATPVDQISRYAGARQAASMIVDYYSVDTKETTTMVGRRVASDGTTTDVELVNDGIFAESDTLLDLKNNQVYYVSKTEGKIVSLVLAESGATAYVDEGDTLVRMGRAAGELDVQTAQFEALPTKTSNYCQIFKAQIEQSTLMRMAHKEVGWSLSDQEESAIFDMRLGMEKSFLFGMKNRIINPETNGEVFLTGGIWNQAGREVNYSIAGLTPESWVKVMRTAFTGSGGNSRKVLVAGSGLIESLSCIDSTSQRVITSGQVVTKWGLDLREIHSKFGTLYVVYSEVFDLCNRADDGLILDPEYMTKYIHIPFNATTLDLRTSGQRNTEAVVLTEASCLVLRYPNVHTRVVGVNS